MMYKTMLSYYQNINPNYRQETHYNYVKNSGFVASTSTGKERDSETGFSYFGARYYDSDLMTGWLSVDPLADKYPSLSPYNYCAWNPVKLVDPDGEEIWIVNSNGDRLKYTIGMSSKGFDNYTTETINALNKLSQTKTLALEMQKMTSNSAISINITESTVTEYNFKEYEGITDKIPNKQKVSFNPYYALESIRSKKVLSPALALGHELGHVYQSFYETSNFLSRRKMVRIDVWNDEEEIHNILNYEYGIANEWNELMRMGHKLTDEDGNKIYNEITTVSSTSVLKNE